MSEGSGYLRLSEAPVLAFDMPRCSACDVRVEETWGADYYICPSCGTRWSVYDGGDEPGIRSSRTVGPECPVGIAWRVSHFSGEERDEQIRKILGVEAAG